ncbi:uncharacterized protein LOC127106642 [Lathyrus oleraceus]|uniref:uncharacterized protein LOC127106642 n=1 Tax=Pisum sativum TaxID=3888 RepID=UPI0021CEDFEC|nr:uncharacterized protein LOC127106642 [Pisum sativum]
MSAENQPSYILQFCGLTDGNPGPAGAGAVLLTKDDRRVLCAFREGLGHRTVNVAEFRALILGMKQAMRIGYKNIVAEGDSRLVINQFQGLWTIGAEDIKALRDKALELKANFQSFRMIHIPEVYNSAAAWQAFEAIDLEDGQVFEDSQVEDDSHDEEDSLG